MSCLFGVQCRRAAMACRRSMRCGFTSWRLEVPTRCASVPSQSVAPRRPPAACRHCKLPWRATTAGHCAALPCRAASAYRIMPPHHPCRRALPHGVQHSATVPQAAASCHGCMPPSAALVMPPRRIAASCHDVVPVHRTLSHIRRNWLLKIMQVDSLVDFHKDHPALLFSFHCNSPFTAAFNFCFHTTSQPRPPNPAAIY